MKTKSQFLSGAFVLMLTMGLITSCKKDDSSEDDLELTTSQDLSFAESAFNDVGNISDEAASYGDVVSYKTSTEQEGLIAGCATVTKDTVSDAPNRIITIDFGSANCVGKDGRSRRGKIIVKHSGNYMDSGATKSVTFDNYFVNDNQVTGSRTVVNNGRNLSGNYNWTVTEQGSVVLADGSGKLTWNSERNRELTEGFSTLDFSDNVYSITGKASGVNSKNIAYTTEITSPLIRKMALGCRRNFVKGTIVLKPSGKLPRTIDFGQGDCDNVATVTINGKSKEIILR